MTTERYESAKITVVNHVERCIHSRHCVLGRPEVFVPNADGPWIKPDQASPDAVAALVQACPSGSLTYVRHDGGEAEQAPGVNSVRLQENGPLEFRAALVITGQEATGYRATLCRCGQSRNKPFCDNSHREADFQATGEPPARPSEPLPVRDGVVTITPVPNGPLLTDGPLEVCAASGRTLVRTTRTALCRCGASQSKPFCDGSHARSGFVAP